MSFRNRPHPTSFLVEKEWGMKAYADSLLNWSVRVECNVKAIIENPQLDAEAKIRQLQRTVL